MMQTRNTKQINSFKNIAKPNFEMEESEIYQIPKQQKKGDEEIIQKYLNEQVRLKNIDPEQFRFYLSQKYPGTKEKLSSISIEQMEEMLNSFQPQSLMAGPFFLPEQEKPQESAVNDKMRASCVQMNSSNVLQNRSRLPSAFFKSDRQSYALNKQIVPDNNPIMQVNQSEVKGNVSELRESKEEGSNISEWVQRVIKDRKGGKVIRQEKQIAPQTSIVKDGFIKKNIEGLECSKIVICKKMEPSKISKYLMKKENDKEESRLSNLRQPNQNEDCLRVIVERYELVGEGLFNDYANYEVITPALGWTVKRRFSDFQWLQNTLRKMHIGLFIPAMAHKTALKELNEDHLFERMRIFEQFLNAVLYSPELSKSEYVSDFLSVSDPSVFESKKRDSLLVNAPLLLDDIQTETGELTCEITPALKEYWKSFRNVNDQSISEYNILQESLDGLVISMENAINHSKSVDSQFMKMGKIHQHFNRVSPLQKEPVLESVNMQMSSFFSGFSESLTNMSVSLQKHICEHIKYHKLTLEDFKYTSSQLFDLETSYLDQLKKLQIKKTKLFAQENTSKWELDKSCELNIKQLQNNLVDAVNHMLPTETAIVKQQGDIFGYLNKSFYQDIHMHLMYSYDTLQNRFILLSKEFAHHIAKLHINIADTNLKFTEYIYNSHINENITNGSHLSIK